MGVRIGPVELVVEGIVDIYCIDEQKTFYNQVLSGSFISLETKVKCPSCDSNNVVYALVGGR